MGYVWKANYWKQDRFSKAFYNPCVFHCIFRCIFSGHCRVYNAQGVDLARLGSLGGRQGLQGSCGEQRGGRCDGMASYIGRSVPLPSFSHSFPFPLNVACFVKIHKAFFVQGICTHFPSLAKRKRSSRSEFGRAWVRIPLFISLYRICKKTFFIQGNKLSRLIQWRSGNKTVLLRIVDYRNKKLARSQLCVSHWHGGIGHSIGCQTHI